MAWFRKRKAPARPDQREQPRQPEQPQPPAPARSRPAPARAGRAKAKEVFDWRSYDAVAEEYERTHAPYTASPAADLLELSGSGPQARVLDVGTGTALGVEIAQASVGLAVGIDAAPKLLVVARRRHPGVRVAAADVLDLPFRDDTFDAAIANFTLPYFRKLDTSLFDIRRVIRPGGRLAVSVWEKHEDELTRTFRQLALETVGPEILRSGIKDETPWAEKLGVPDQLETVLRDAGFRPVSVEERSYRVEMSREDYIVSQEVEAVGRFVRAMLGERLWEGFRQRVRAAYAERFDEQVVDFRYALLAVGSKPE